LCKYRLNPRAPEWRASKAGLNVEGECCNEDCVAFGEIVIDALGFTAYNLQEEAHCPCCSAVIQPLTCGFRRCVWMFEGRKRGVCSIHVQSERMKAGNKYGRFNHEATEGRAAAEWSSLIITAKKLPSTRNMIAFVMNSTLYVNNKKCVTVPLTISRF
jgi:hypothetical protein